KHTMLKNGSAESPAPTVGVFLRKAMRGVSQQDAAELPTGRHGVGGLSLTALARLSQASQPAARRARLSAPRREAHGLPAGNRVAVLACPSRRYCSRGREVGWQAPTSRLRSVAMVVYRLNQPFGHPQ